MTIVAKPGWRDEGDAMTTARDKAGQRDEGDTMVTTQRPL